MSPAAPRYAIYETEQMLDALERDGYATVAQALPAQNCAQACEMIDALRPLHWDKVDASVAQCRPGRRVDRYLCVFNRDPYWLQFTDRPGLIDLAEAALGADCHIIAMTAWRSHPGYRAEALHVDYLPFSNGDSALVSQHIPVFILTVHFYLTDVTADLAPTRIVPGSHRAARPPRVRDNAWEGREPEIILARAGDALLFRSDVWHAGSDNRSQHDTRYLLQVHYGRREMAQHFSPFTEWRFNPAVLAAASKRQRRLLGDHEPGAYD